MRPIFGLTLAPDSTKQPGEKRERVKPSGARVFAKVQSHRQWKRLVGVLGHSPQTYYNFRRRGKGTAGTYHFYISAGELRRLKEARVKVTRARSDAGWNPTIDFLGPKPRALQSPARAPKVEPTVPKRSLKRWNELALATLAEGGWKVERRDPRGGRPGLWPFWTSNPEQHVGSTMQPGETGAQYDKAIRAIGDELLVAMRDTGPITLPDLAEIVEPGRKLDALKKKRLGAAAANLIETGAITFRMVGDGVQLWSDLYNLRDGRATFTPIRRGKTAYAGEGSLEGQRSRALQVIQRVGSRYHDPKKLHRMFLDDVIARYHKGSVRGAPHLKLKVSPEVFDELVALVGKKEAEKDWKWLMEEMETPKAKAKAKPKAKTEPKTKPKPKAASELKPIWKVLQKDAQGKVTRRVWELPKLSAWTGTAVFDERPPGLGRKRYQLVHEKDGAYRDVGLSFASQRKLLKWMADNRPKVEYVAGKAPNDLDVSAWALQGLSWWANRAPEQWIRSHFQAQHFRRAISKALSEGLPVVPIEAQKRAIKLWDKHAETFLRDMYRAHDNGRIPFGERPGAVKLWVDRYRSTT